MVIHDCARGPATTRASDDDTFGRLRKYSFGGRLTKRRAEISRRSDGYLRSAVVVKGSSLRCSPWRATMLGHSSAADAETETLRSLLDGIGKRRRGARAARRAGYRQVPSPGGGGGARARAQLRGAERRWGCSARPASGSRVCTSSCGRCVTTRPACFPPTAPCSTLRSASETALRRSTFASPWRSSICSARSPPSAPLLVIVEDAHWLDRPSSDVLAFVARRLESDPIVLLAAVRDGTASSLVDAGLPEHPARRARPRRRGGAAGRSAKQLTPTMRNQILREAAGNPLALIELPIATARAGAGHADAGLGAAHRPT